MPLETNEPNGNNGNKWSDYMRLVLSELERLQKAIDELNQRLTETREKDIPTLRTDITVLKTKAFLLGTLGGTVFSAIMFAVFEWLIKR